MTVCHSVATGTPKLTVQTRNSRPNTTLSMPQTATPARAQAPVPTLVRDRERHHEVISVIVRYSHVLMIPGD